MSAKLVRTLLKIANDVGNVDGILKSDDEYYFRYGGHSFSIIERSTPNVKWGRYGFFVYPKWTGDLSDLCGIYDGDHPGETEMMGYDSKDYTDEPFKTLYSAIAAKYLGVDRIFDQILGE